MLFALSTLFASIAVASASVSFTAPVAATVVTAGKAFTLKWQDDGIVPTLATFGTGNVSIAVGGTVSQDALATLATVDFATATSVSVTIPVTVGPAVSGVYFIRVDSTTTDPTSTTGAVYEAFSAKFDLVGATGTFTAAQAAIATGNTTITSSSSSASSASLPAAATISKSPTSSSSRSTITSTLGPTSFANSTHSGAIVLTPIRALSFLGGLAAILGVIF